MSEPDTYVCIRSSVLVRDDDGVRRLEIQSIVPDTWIPQTRDQHAQSITDELARLGLIFESSIGALHHQTIPTMGYTAEQHTPVQIEALDIP